MALQDVKENHVALRDPKSSSQPGHARVRHGHRPRAAAGFILMVSVALGACAGTPATSIAPSVSASPAASATGTPQSQAPGSPSAAPSASGPGGTAQELALNGTDFAFSGPASIPAGPTRITLTNAGQEEHQAQIAGFTGGSTIEDLTAALQSNDEVAALGMLALSGGPTGVMPGDTGSTSGNLAPGQYVFLCFVRSADGIPHFAKGMISPLEVTEPASTAELPAGDAELALQDFAFVGLSTMTAGPHTVTVTNNGPQPHEATIVQLAEGIEATELIPMFSSTEPPTGAPPFVSVGGVAGIAPGQTITMDVDLEPGNYAFLCFVPDPASGQPHVVLGMVGALTVE